MADSQNIMERKRNYRNTLLNIIRREPYTSRSVLKERSGLSMETVLQTVESMRSDGLIYESGTGGASVGRKATWLSVNPSGQYFVGIKFNSLQLCCVLLDFYGKTVLCRNLALPKDITAETLTDRIFSCIRETLDFLGPERTRLCGVCIGAPGVINRDQGVLVRYAHIRTLLDIPIRLMIEEKFGVRTIVEHSLKLAMLAHKMNPENENIHDMLYVLVKSGVGMSMMINNEVYSGFGNSAGEIGHIKVTENGRLCQCGRMGCLESEIGYGAIEDSMRQGMAEGKYPMLTALCGGEKPRIWHFIKAVESGDPDALTLFRHAEELLGAIVVSAVTILNPQKIIFSGDIPMLPGFLDDIRKEVDERCPIEAARMLRMEANNTDDLFDATGAACLVMHEEFGSWGMSFPFPAPGK